MKQERRSASRPLYVRPWWFVAVDIFFVLLVLAHLPRSRAYDDDAVAAMDSGLFRSLGGIPSSRFSMWQEFRHGAPIVGAIVTPCPTVGYCSSASTHSQPLSTLYGPWTFQSSTCLNLTVMEGYYSGQAVYQVKNRGRVLGNTSTGSYSEKCWDDPDACYAMPASVVGRGSWLLSAGNHTLSIGIARLTSDYPQDANDGGWFRVSPTSCPCSAVNAACPAASLSSCCSGLVCRRNNAVATTGPLRCLSCLTKSQPCASTTNCCSGLRCLAVRQGSSKKVCK